MAAYAALVSLEHIINNLQTHCRPPITLHIEQVHLLTQKINFLLEFLQVYNPNLPYSKEADPLESRIARAAYAAEDAIESHILDQFTDDDGENMSSDGLYEALGKVIEDMALIEKEAMEIKQTVEFQKKSTPLDSSGSTSSSSIAHKKSVSMVGAGDLLLEMKSRLTADTRDLQTIPIVGMGGSGKTTLALNIYQDGLIKEHFHTCAWVTISQEYSTRQILIQLLTQLISEPNQGLSEGELGEMLHKHLYGKKYMIILDDMWSVKAYDGVKKFLPNNKKGSRIVITTRLATLASALPNSNSLRMTLLDEDASWDLLSETVFGEKKNCPLELEGIGKKIGKNYKGLPLSIVVVGGLLAKSKQTREFWENVEKNLNEIVNLEDDERCLETLHMSYKQLPVHLKPCFLYMGIYSEDHTIRISDIIRLWVSEGFLKSIIGKMLEDVASAYLTDLIDRNLIMIHKLGSIGSIKECKVHDLLRDLCLREVQKERFYIVYPGEEIKCRMSRIVLTENISKILLRRNISETEEIDALSYATLARSLIFGDDVDVDQHLSPHILRLVRILGCHIGSDEFIDDVHQLVNSRLFSFYTVGTEFPSLIWQFWNLQTLIFNQYSIRRSEAPTDIWYMPHIRHLSFNNSSLPDPPNAQDGIVLANLHSLGMVRHFKCSKQVVKRIPNIRKLEVSYVKEGDEDMFCLTDLDCLDRLESLTCEFGVLAMYRINYPRSLKKLSIRVDTSRCWKDMLDKIGALPLLQKLKLSYGTFEGQWETTEGQFRSLKYLSLECCEGLQVWETEASHFPRLEHLYLLRVDDLEEVPSDIAEISTLGVIHVNDCSDSAAVSAKRILEEQEALYGEEETTLQVRVWLLKRSNIAKESFRGSRNFDAVFFSNL